jgi:hypothetical protein
LPIQDEGHCRTANEYEGQEQLANEILVHLIPTGIMKQTPLAPVLLHRGGDRTNSSDLVVFLRRCTLYSMGVAPTQPSEC